MREGIRDLVGHVTLVGEKGQKDSASAVALESLSSAVLGQLFITVWRVGTLALNSRRGWMLCTCWQYRGPVGRLTLTIWSSLDSGFPA